MALQPPNLFFQNQNIPGYTFQQENQLPFQYQQDAFGQQGVGGPAQFLPMPQLTLPALSFGDNAGFASSQDIPTTPFVFYATNVDPPTWDGYNYSSPSPTIPRERNILNQVLPQPKPFKTRDIGLRKKRTVVKPFGCC